MNDLEKKFYARHIAALDKPKSNDVQHWKYISKKRGSNGKWQYKYEEGGKANKLTGRTDHTYTKNEIDPSDPSKWETNSARSSSYEVIDDTTQVRFTYDEATKEVKFDFADGHVDKDAKLTKKEDPINFETVYEYTYTKNGVSYKTTARQHMNGSIANFKTRNLATDTVVEKVVDKVKGLFKKK